MRSSETNQIFVFYDHKFEFYYGNDGELYVPLKDLCAPLGIDYNGQKQRVSRDHAINDQLVNLKLETPYRDTTRVRDVACLNIKALPYWLGSIDANRIKEEHRNTVILYKREFAYQAWEHFKSDILPEDVLAEMISYKSEAEQLYSQAQDNLRQQRKELDLLTGRLDHEIELLGAKFEDYDGRLGKLENYFKDDEPTISTENIWRIKKILAMIAESLANKDTSRTKHHWHALVQNDFRDTFQIPSYALLPEKDLDEAIRYLRARWMKANKGKPVPEIFGGYQKNLF